MKRAVLIIYTVAIIVAVAAAPAGATHIERLATWEKAITGSVLYRHYKLSVDGSPAHAFVLEISLDSPYLEVRPILANDRLDSLETVPDMAERTGALAAINGSYFNTKPSNPFPVGFIMIDGRTVYFSHQNRSAFGLTENNVPLFGYPKTRGIIFNERTGDYFYLWAMNGRRQENEVLVYTPEFGATTKTNEFGKEVVVSRDKVVAITKGDTPIPNDGYVLSLHGSGRQYLNWLELGDRAKLYFLVDPSWLSVHNALTGGPLLIKGGKIVLDESEAEKLYLGKTKRIPITAVGSTADGRLFFVVVDGRQKGYSLGMTYAEMAHFMKSLGAINAICMDGGGSSVMWINGVTVNKPSDGKPRAVANGIALFMK